MSPLSLRKLDALINQTRELMTEGFITSAVFHGDAEEFRKFGVR